MPPHVDHESSASATPSDVEPPTRHSTMPMADVQAAIATATAASAQRQQNVGWVVIVILICCCACFMFQYRAIRKRQAAHENEPLLAEGHSSAAAAPTTPSARGRQDVASIGTPARDFVRLSSLPAAIFELNENRCRASACNQAEIAAGVAGSEAECDPYSNA